MKAVVMAGGEGSRRRERGEAGRAQDARHIGQRVDIRGTLEAPRRRAAQAAGRGESQPAPRALAGEGKARGSTQGRQARLEAVSL